MKKLLLVIVFALPMMAAAQVFTLTANGFVNAEDPSKDYAVVEIEGTQAELFNKAKTAATAMWGAAKEVLSYNEPDIIVINGVGTKVMDYTFMGMISNYDVPYRLQLQFKDGRMRIDAPSANKGIVSGGRGEIYFDKGGRTSLFKKNGEVRYENMRSQVDTYFNTLISVLVDKMKNGAAQEDW